MITLPHPADNKMVSPGSDGITCRAETLACLRVIVFGIIAWTVWREDIVSSALLGEAFRFPMGAMTAFRHLDALAGKPFQQHAVLVAFQWVALVFSLLSVVGACKSISLPVTTICYAVFAGILREYSHLFHSGLLPLYLAAVLSAMPCADALSVDRWRGASRETRSAYYYGWCRMACWGVIAIVYFAAGYSKLTNGGLMWWSGDNLRQIVLTDCMNPMQFDWDIGLKLKDGPLAIFAGMGLTALIIETLYPLVLIKRWARVVFPIGAAGMHAGIFFFQNILFLDLILLQLCFVDWDWLFGKSRIASASLDTTGKRADAERVSRMTMALWCVLLVIVVGKVEYYPLTSWQMYSGKGDGDQAVYFHCEETLSDGETRQADFARVFPILIDTRYRDILQHSIREHPDKCREFARRYMMAANTEFASSRAARIDQVIMQRRVWVIDQSAPNYDQDVVIDEVVVRSTE